MIDVPVTPEMIKWVVQTGITIPLLLYVAYHIKWGKIAEISGALGSIIKVLIAVGKTNDDIREDEVIEEFQPNERAVDDFIETSDDRKQNGDRTTIQQDD